MQNHVIINVGRQFGSGGKSIADAMGAKLGIPVYDNKLIIRAAEESNISPEFFEQSDEQKSLLSLGLLSSSRFGGVTQNAINDVELFKMQSDTIRDIASKGDAIFVGRASDYVLRDMSCLDVFICAPAEFRRSLVAKREGLTEAEAVKLMAKTDKNREAYYNFFTFGLWGVASNYDLCVDSSLLGFDATADFIIDFGRRAGLLP